MKNVVDRVAAGALLAVLSPLMLLVGLLVLFGTGMPVLFRQRRVGLHGREFTIFKFRTMRGNPAFDGEADEGWFSAVLNGEPPERSISPAGADRCTRVGGYLRRFGLDELPQLFNVLRGDMALVGPRPERPQYVEAFAQRFPTYHDRHRVKPGVIGWAQVNGLRGESSIAERLDLDNYYIEQWSPRLELTVYLLLIPALLRGTRTRMRSRRTRADAGNGLALGAGPRDEEHSVVLGLEA